MATGAEGRRSEKKTRKPDLLKTMLNPLSQQLLLTWKAQSTGVWETATERRVLVRRTGPVSRC